MLHTVTGVEVIEHPILTYDVGVPFTPTDTASLDARRTTGGDGDHRLFHPRMIELVSKCEQPSSKIN